MTITGLDDDGLRGGTIDPGREGAPGTSDGDGRRQEAAGRARRRERLASSGTVLAFAVVFVVYAIWLQGDFLDVSRRMFDISRSAPQLLLATGVVVCLAAHHFDLSVASMATLSVFLTIGLHLQSDIPMWLSILIALGVGALGGLVNGLLVTRLNLSAFIATLGTGGVFGGLTVVYSEGRIIGPSPSVGTLPSWFTGPGSLGDFQQKVPLLVGLLCVALIAAAFVVSVHGRFALEGWRRGAPLTIAALLVLGSWALGVIGEMSWSIFVLITFAGLVWVYLTYTASGRATYAIGGSERAAQFAGIDTKRKIVAAFVLSGTTAALAGVLLASIQGSASPHLADPLLLPAYSAVFLSTVLMSRGRFHVWGTVFGGIFLIYVSSGLIAGGVPFTWTSVINGLVLIATVSLSTILRRRK